MIDTLELTQGLGVAGVADLPQAQKVSTALKENLSGATVSKGDSDPGPRPLRADTEAAVARPAQRFDTHDKLLWFIAAGIVALFAPSFLA